MDRHQDRQRAAGPVEQPRQEKDRKEHQRPDERHRDLVLGVAGPGEGHEVRDDQIDQRRPRRQRIALECLIERQHPEKQAAPIEVLDPVAVPGATGVVAHQGQEGDAPDGERQVGEVRLARLPPLRTARPRGDLPARQPEACGRRGQERRAEQRMQSEREDQERGLAGGDERQRDRRRDLLERLPGGPPHGEKPRPDRREAEEKREERGERQVGHRGAIFQFQPEEATIASSRQFARSGGVLWRHVACAWAP